MRIYDVNAVTGSALLVQKKNAGDINRGEERRGVLYYTVCGDGSRGGVDEWVGVLGFQTGRYHGRVGRYAGRGQVQL